MFGTILNGCSKDDVTNDNIDTVQSEDRILIETSNSNIVWRVNEEEWVYAGRTKRQLTINANSPLKVEAKNANPGITNHFSLIIWINNDIVYEKSDDEHSYSR